MKDTQAFVAAVLRLQGATYEEIAGLLGITREEAVEKAHKAVQDAQFEEPVADNPEDLKTPEQWSEELGDAILDPDGWRFRFKVIDGEEVREYNPRHYREPVGKQEYEDRRNMSTTSLRKTF